MKKISARIIIINMGKDHIVSRADIYTRLFALKKFIQCHQKTKQETLFGKNYIHPVLEKVEYKLVQYFWKAIWP